MKRQIAMVAVAVFLAFVVAGSVAKADITYTIADQGAYYQNGWSVDGTITTDGHLGQFYAEGSVFNPAPYGHLLSATLTLSNPTYGVYTATDLSFFGGYSMVATPTELQLPFIGGSLDQFGIFGANGISIGWYNPFTITTVGGVPNTPEYGYMATYEPPESLPESNAWGAIYEATGDQPGQDSYLTPPELQTLGPDMPWVIATAVPEPGTLTLLVSALLGLAGAFYLRRRRAGA